MNKRQREKIEKRIQYYFNRDILVKHRTFAKLLGDRKVISIQINPLNDFRYGEQVVIPENVLMYQSVIMGCDIHAKEINIDGCYMTLMNNRVMSND